MRKDYKIVVADIDRTLRERPDQFGDINRRAFQALHERGVLLGIASGRPLWQRLTEHAKEWGLGFEFDFLIGLNGGEVYDAHTGITKSLNPLQPDDIKEIITKMEVTNCNPFIYGDGYMLARWDDDLVRASAKRNRNEARIAKDVSEFWEKPVGKILFRTETEEQMKEVVEPFARTLENDTYFCFKTAVNLIEFQDRRNNKGTAVAEYCRDNGISLEDVMAFGDAENDLEMMKMAGYSVCLCNGMPENKAIADAVTEYRASEDGFGRWIFDHYLSE